MRINKKDKKKNNYNQPGSGQAKKAWPLDLPIKTIRPSAKESEKTTPGK